jgi:DNA modification methylase
LRRTADWFFETWHGLLLDGAGAPLALVANPDNPEGMHRATFPEALVEPCIAAGSRAGDTVLDPFAGSGTVAVVALRAGRDFIGIDLNPEYVEMARRRIEGTAPLFLSMDSSVQDQAR